MKCKLILLSIGRNIEISVYGYISLRDIQINKKKF